MDGWPPSHRRKPSPRPNKEKLLKTHLLNRTIREARVLSKRVVILGISLLIVAAFFSLLGWAMAHSGGAPGGMGVNKVFGAISIQEKPAPNFTLHLLDGSSITLADLKGTVVLIDFWASWCPPCRDEASALAQVYTEYQDRGVEFIGISIWDRLGDAEDYVQHFEITYPTGLDSEGAILVDYAVRGIPEKFFIDANGLMHSKYIGPSDVNSLRDSLNQMLTGRN